ncbi:hypothetical protein Nepgr_007386 [Nepenthes gracilis]|uniref:Heme-binding protein 2 n=1 Tax=Nepenthes gracilis TaxID=150966 RepID=A0AAD3S740_NEPGR|nr:hypothetical protein Nepgr_007386 [Nepenthes gracilis]
MAAFSFLKLSLLFNFFSNAHPNLWTDERSSGVAKIPAPCSRIECPIYDVIHMGNGYEIRRYNTSLWMSTSTLQDISFVEGTRTGFMQLFNYIQGKNEYKKKIEMTAPVLTKVVPSDGPFCESSFVVSFYVPKVDQADPPPAKGLHAEKWNHKYTAVRQFGGFVSDSDVAEEAAALQASLAGTDWYATIKKNQNSTSVYTVAQYNSPFEFDNRVNEIWLAFDMQ